MVYVDERDRMEDIPNEGDVVTLADARHSTYPDGTTIVTSSPLIGNVEEKKNLETGLTHWAVADADDVQSPIWKLWQQGTRHEWAWPCPDCHEYFIPRFSLLNWPKGSTPHEAKLNAKLTCPNCGVLIDDSNKTQMNTRGRVVAPGQSINRDGVVSGDVPENDTFSIWVSGLCSPWRSFGQRASYWLNAVKSGDSGRIQAVLNTGFGELFKLGADSPEWQTVLNRQQQYPSGTLPDKQVILIMTVDVQKDRLFYVIRAWGYGMESWMISNGELWGQTEHNAVWDDLEKLMQKPIDDYMISLVLIDSGYRPGDKHKKPENAIYMFCARFPGVCRPTKGHAEQDKPIKSTHIDVNSRGRIIKSGLQLWHINANYFKTFVYGRLSPPEGEPDKWHIPNDVTEDYCKQVTAEAPVSKPSGQVVWIRNRKDNHYLDCEAMQVAGAYMMRVQDMAPPVVQVLPTATASNGETYQKDGLTRRRSNYL